MYNNLKMTSGRNTQFLILLFLSLWLTSCNNANKHEKKEGQDNNSPSFGVTVKISNDPDNLHPYNASSMEAFSINGQFFQSLTAVDFKTLKLVPVLAESRPSVERIERNGVQTGLSFTYRLRKEAVWDDGKPITAKDVEFSLKALKNPLVNDEPLRIAYSDLDSIHLYPEDDKKFTIYSLENSIRAEAAAGGFVILPKHIMDPEDLMKKFNIFQLNDEKQIEKLKEDENIKKFANFFNSEKFLREPKYLIGSGPYILEKWESGQRLLLKKKKNWWGNKISDENTYFEVYPDHLIYMVINDPNSAVVAVKSEQIDVLGEIPPKSFIDLKENAKFNEKYNLYTPDENGYTCITINLKNKILKDLEVRRALAMLIDQDFIVDNIFQKTACKTHSMEHPSNKATYNNDIVEVKYNPSLAKQNLEKDGWKDSDGDGVLDKAIDGKKEKMQFELLLNTGNIAREKIAKTFQEEARKIGIKINLIPKDLNLVTQLQRDHKFELSFNGWVSSALPYDPKQVWHTDAIHNGFNFMSFGNKASDALIDSLRVELDEQKRIMLFKKFQNMVYQEMPVLFLYGLKGRIAIHKKFKNAYPSALRPGYNESGFKIVGQ